MQQPGIKIKEIYPYEFKKLGRINIGTLIIIMVLFFSLSILTRTIIILFILIPFSMFLVNAIGENSIGSLILYKNGIQPYVPKFNTQLMKKRGFIQFNELKRIRYSNEYWTQFRMKLNFVELFLKDLKNNGPIKQYVDTKEDCMLIINTFERYKEYLNSRI